MRFNQIAFLVAIMCALCGCTSSHLSQSQAQVAVDEALKQVKANGNLSLEADAHVLGVTEGNDNTAIADINFSNATYSCGWSMPPEQWGNGKAGFKKYNDKGWVLTELSSGQILCSGVFPVNIPVH